MEENEISKIILDTCIQIHREVGPGLLESVYETLLTYELAERGLIIKKQVPVPLIYNGIVMDIAFRMDMIVEDKVVIEIKSVETLSRAHFKQLLTYLRLADKRLGLLVNFNEALLKEGFHRVVNNLII